MPGMGVGEVGHKQPRGRQKQYSFENFMSCSFFFLIHKIDSQWCLLQLCSRAYMKSKGGVMTGARKLAFLRHKGCNNGNGEAGEESQLPI